MRLASVCTCTHTTACWRLAWCCEPSTAAGRQSMPPTAYARLGAQVVECGRFNAELVSGTPPRQGIVYGQNHAGFQPNTCHPGHSAAMQPVAPSVPKEAAVVKTRPGYICHPIITGTGPKSRVDAAQPPFGNRPVVTSLPLQTAETAAFSHFSKQKRVPSPVAWCCITRSSHMRLCLG